MGDARELAQERRDRSSERKGAGLGSEKRALEEAAAFAANVLPIIESLRSAGVRDLRGLASALNNRGVRTARGGRWWSPAQGPRRARAGRVCVGGPRPRGDSSSCQLHSSICHL